MSRSCLAVWVFASILCFACAVHAKTGRPSLEVPAAAQASAAFDAEAATEAYLDELPADARARSDAYFEGGQWLILWDAVLLSGILVALLKTGISARMRSVARRVTSWPGVHVLVYWAELALVVSLGTFPLTVYEDFYREHLYGLSTQTFGQWLGEESLEVLLTLVFGGLLIVTINRVMSHARRIWWIWGAVVFFSFQVVGAVVAPVYIAPLFNSYTKLDDPAVTAPILRMARANGVPVSDVYVVDASRQSTRISANVSGLFGTERIALNDNLLNNASLEEIESVMGHEIGHYVLNHVYQALLVFAVLIILLFAALYHGSGWALKRWGARWQIREVDDPAAIPLLGLIALWFVLLATPVVNTLTRTEEFEADLFALNAARQPDGHAAVALRLSDYRKLDPGPVEEFLLFDHPSGRRRILAAMRWKAEHLANGVSSKVRSGSVTGP